MTVFFTSDLHIGHKMVAMERWKAVNPYGTPDPLVVPGVDVTPENAVIWHSRLLAYNWDRLVTKDDTVWVLGDLSLQGRAAIEGGLEWISNRPGTKKFITGNHDSCHMGIERRESGKWIKRYLEFFDVVFPFARIRVNGQVVLLSHFPYAGDHTAIDRFPQWRLPDLGDWLLHGHTHSSEIWTPGPSKMIHVGVDAHGYTPVSTDQIVTLMEDHESAGQTVLSGES
jgi:calcineurin-like phosphoesterase family protein